MATVRATGRYQPQSDPKLFANILQCPTTSTPARSSPSAGAFSRLHMPPRIALCPTATARSGSDELAWCGPALSSRCCQTRISGGTRNGRRIGNRTIRYAIRGSRVTSRRAWRRFGVGAPDGSSAMAGSATAAIACRAARCPRNAVRPGLVSVTCRREREFARTRETSTYPASASADRCLLRTESEISRLSRMSENGNHRTGESIAHICRRKGAWINSSNTASLTVAMPETPMPIGSVRGEQAGRNDHSHGCTKSPAHKSRIAAAGEQMGADHAADKHRDSDQREFGDAPFRLRRRAQRAPLVTSGHPQQLGNKPHERDDGHHVSRSLVRGRDRLRSAEDTHREDEPRWGRRTTNRSVMCLAGGP